MFKFGYKFVVHNTPAGIFTGEGSLGADGVHLGGELLPYHCIKNCEQIPDGGRFRSDRLSLHVTTDQQVLPRAFLERVWDERLVLQVYKAPAEEMRREIVIRCSRHELKKIKEKLESRGQAGDFRSAVCPHCNAALDLTGLTPKPYVFCQHCKTFWKKNSDLEKAEQYKVCDRCGFFDRTRSYIEFYCYPWVTLVHLVESRRTLCDACARALSRRMMVLNLFLFLGVPNALWCALRSLSSKDPRMRALSRANSLARKGRVERADTLYREVLEHFPDHPGIKYNQARAYLKGEEVEKGIEHLNEVLDSYPNFAPAGEMLDHLASIELVAKARVDGRDQAVLVGTQSGQASSEPGDEISEPDQAEEEST